MLRLSPASHDPLSPPRSSRGFGRAAPRKAARPPCPPAAGCRPRPPRPPCPPPGPPGPPPGPPRANPPPPLPRLLLDAGRAAPAETLTAALWDDVPASAHKVVQVYVSQLRKALGPDAIETRAPGYLLRAGPDEHDLGVFERLVTEAGSAAEPGRRSALLRNALELWRGSPLAEFREEPFAHAAGRRLEELHLNVLERR